MKILDITKEKQDKSRILVETACAKAFSPESNYTVVYAFLLKGLFFNSRAYNFLLGFNTDKKELCIAQFNKEGVIIGETIVLTQNQILSIKTYKTGVVKITNTETDKPVKLTVPAILPDVAELYDQLPIEQKDEARLFYKFIKAVQEEITTRGGK